MQNAHERFGTLEFTKRMKDTTTRVRVYIDRVVLEPARNEQGQSSAHLISMIGGDSEIGAMWAAVTQAELFHIHLPDRTGLAASLGPEAQCFRGSLAVPGRKRPSRHLTAGMLNGIFGQGQSRHIAHWQSVKVVDKTEEQNEDGTVMIREQERFGNELTLAFANGKVTTLK